MKYFNNSVTNSANWFIPVSACVYFVFTRSTPSTMKASFCVIKSTSSSEKVSFRKTKIIPTLVIFHLYQTLKLVAGIGSSPSVVLSEYRVFTFNNCSSKTSLTIFSDIDPPSIGDTISGSTTYCAGSNSTIITLSGYTGTIVKWEYSADSWATSPVAILNATPTLTTNLTASTQFRVVFKSGGCAATTNSDAFFSVDEMPVAGTALPQLRMARISVIQN